MPLPVLLLALLPTPASAADDACTGPYPVKEWWQAMDDAEAAIRDLDGAKAAEILDTAEDDLACLDEQAMPEDVARFARAEALVAWFAQDKDEAERWGLLYRESDWKLLWPDGLPHPDGFDKLVFGAAEPELAGPEGKALAVPKGGGVLLDGRLVTTPKARAGVPHLVQVVDKKGDPVSTSWQDGAAFADALLGPAGPAPKPPAWWVDLPDPGPPPPPPSDEAVAQGAGDAGAAEDAADSDEPAPPSGPHKLDASPGAGSQGPLPDHPGQGDPGALGTNPQAVITTGGPVHGGSHPRPTGAPVSFEHEQQGCPWKGDPKDVEAHANRVTIEGTDYAVHRAEDQQAFRKTLRACYENRAVRRFNRWRDARKHHWFKASKYKDAMVDALVTPEPPKKKHHRGHGGGDDGGAGSEG